MDGLGEDVRQKIRSAIKAKLNELGTHVDEELPDYIMVLVGNKKTREQMEDDLQLFLGSNTAEFTNWLHQVLQKLQEVTVANLEKKRKFSATDSESESVKKEKLKKLPEKRKIKRSGEQIKEKDCHSSEICSKEISEKKSENIQVALSEPGKILTSSVEPARIIRRVSDAGRVTKVVEDIKQNHEPETSQTKIVLMQSDDEDDDEDFINIKADAEAGELPKKDEPLKEALLDAELPKEVQEVHVIPKPDPPEIKQRASNVQVSEKLGAKIGSGSILDRLGTKETSFVYESSKHVSPLLRVSQQSESRIPITERLGKRKLNADDQVKISSRLGTKVTLPSGRRTVSVAHVAPTSVDRISRDTTNTKLEIDKKSTRRLPAEEDTTNNEQIPRKRPLLSRVVALNKEVGVKEEEEYDPANPAVGSVASVVRVKPRPKIPAALQANKNLILKAMAEAQKSVANAPKRIDIEERSESSYTKKLWENKGRNKIAITLPNRKMKAQDKSQNNEKTSDIDRIVIPVKLDSSRSISSVNLQQKIVIQVSSDRPSTSSRIETEPQIPLPVEDADDDAKLAEVVPDAEVETEAETEAEELRDEGFEEIHRFIPNESQDLELEEEHCDTEIPISSSEIPRTESPQFVVTLDGLDPTIFNARKRPKSPTILVTSSNLEANYEKKERQKMEKAPEKRSVSPILFKKTGIDDAGVSSDTPAKQKISERCKYWPACRSGDKCEYVHPTAPCKAFPSCKFGDKCLYIHPNCKFDASCTRKDCPFTHASPRSVTASVAVPPTKTSQQVCKFYPKCSNVNCRFLHPKVCRYGRFCNRKAECSYRHEEIPTADKLKWICPFRL